MKTSNGIASVDTALSHGLRLLENEPLLAAEQARQILRAAPDEPAARLLLGMAHNALRESERALDVLQALIADQPDSARGWLELAVAQMALGQDLEAADSLERAASLQPALPLLWLRFAALMERTGAGQRAAKAYLAHARTANKDPKLVEAGKALAARRWDEAEQLLRTRLAKLANDVSAMRMLAEVQEAQGQADEAAALLERCLALAPDFAMARHQYAMLLNRRGLHREALMEVDVLSRADPDNQGLLEFKRLLSDRLAASGGEQVRTH